MRSLPPVDGMDALRTLTSALAHYDAEAGDTAPQAQYRKAVRLTAQTGIDRRHLGAAARRAAGRLRRTRRWATPPTSSTC